MQLTLQYIDEMAMTVSENISTFLKNQVKKTYSQFSTILSEVIFLRQSRFLFSKIALGG